MRAHDVGIGLAVAWARRADTGLESEAYRSFALLISPPVVKNGVSSGYVDMLHRGPVVEPVPLVDMRVAFGIAMAHCGPWRRVPLRLFGVEVAKIFSPGVGNMILHNGLIEYVQHDSGIYVRVDDMVIDLDPRRWLENRIWIRVPTSGPEMFAFGDALLQWWRSEDRCL